MLFELDITRPLKAYMSVTSLTGTLAKSLEAHQGEMNSIFTLMIPEISIQTSRISGCLKTGDMSVI